MGFFNCSVFFCALLYVHSSFAIILTGTGKLVALLISSPWCLVIVVWLFLAMPRVRLPFVIVVYPYHTLILFLEHCVCVVFKQGGSIGTLSSMENPNYREQPKGQLTR